MSQTLGQRMFVAGFAVAGALAEEEMKIVLAEIVALVGMDTAGMPAKAWAYPLTDGQGGVGETICQPLVESFIISDSWPDLFHKGRAVPKTYVILASCRSFDPRVPEAHLTREIGPVLRQGYFEL